MVPDGDGGADAKPILTVSLFTEFPFSSFSLLITAASLLRRAGATTCFDFYHRCDVQTKLTKPKGAPSATG